MQVIWAYAREEQVIKTSQTISQIEKESLRSLPLPQALGSWNYYRALEESKSLVSSNGWNPVYIYDDKNPHEAFVPMFSKTNSNDDFSYDQNLANAYQTQFGEAYYPKLQICIPFVPFEGSKLYTLGSKKELVEQLQAWAIEKSYKSIHITLPDTSEYELLVELGFMPSTQSLCYWNNENDRSFSDFLDRFKSKYRSQITQERNVIKEKNYRHFFVTGSNLTPDYINQFYDLFELTHRRKDWVMSYLTRDFFHSFAKTNFANIVLIFISLDEKIVAASCNFLQEDLLCGRFWGSVTDEDFLHFEVMYYLPIEYCIQHRIAQMEIGFEKHHKVIRGFVPKEVKSFHWFSDLKVREKLKSFTSVNLPSNKNIFR